ncbi:hypothetical protein QYF36_022005 [Acer negundo]|nr:hypothetical protein QYF36_022005 [Acer negundo]
MVLFIMAIVVEAGTHVDKKCYQKCFAKYCRGRYTDVCAAGCLRRCQVPDSEALNDCTFTCANSKCNHFTSDKVDEVEGCVYSCSEDCEKKN